MEETRRDLGLLILRLFTGGVMLAQHGWPKLMAFSEKAAKFPDPLGVGNENSLMLTIFAEVLCAALLMAGFLTRLVVLPLLVAMGVAFFIIHDADPFAKKELALMYAIPYLTLLLAGPGNLSFDRFIKFRKPA